MAAGTNRFVWDMRYLGASKVDGFAGGDVALIGPLAAPGFYQVRLIVGDQEQSASFEIHKDQRVAATQQDLEAQFALRLRIRDKLSETHDAIGKLRDLRQQVEAWERRVQGQEAQQTIMDAGKALVEQLTAIEEELIQVKAKVRQDTLNHPAKLNVKLAALGGVVASADAAPTQQMYALFDDLAARIDVQLKRLQEIIETDVQSFNTLIHETGVPAIG